MRGNRDTIVTLLRYTIQTCSNTMLLCKCIYECNLFGAVDGNQNCDGIDSDVEAK